MFVIQRKSDQKFALGKESWRTSFSSDLQEARVYSTKTAASNSINWKKNRAESKLDYEIREVKLLLI